MRYEVRLYDTADGDTYVVTYKTNNLSRANQKANSLSSIWVYPDYAFPAVYDTMTKQEEIWIKRWQKKRRQR
jgi:hypothetical protein